jgi:E3 ubiquitin-protein ligase DOA10
MNLNPLNPDIIVNGSDPIETNCIHNLEQLCRICMASMEEHEVNNYCHCSGSTGLIHKQCLLTWILESCRISCEICHHTFDIVKTYKFNWVPILQLIFVIMWVVGICLFMVIRYKENIPFILILMSIFIIIALLFTKASINWHILKSINIKAYSENTRLLN